MNILFLNGPPNSGKDTIAEYLESNYGYKHLRFKDTLYKLTALLNNYDYNEFYKTANDRNLKDSKKLRRDKTARELLIETSEVVVKPVYGKEYFAKATLLDIVNDNEYKNFVISDCGFQEEYDFIADSSYDHYNVNLYFISLTRPDCNFNNDSRNYVNPDPLHTTSTIIVNDSNLDDLLTMVDDFVKEFKDE